MWDDLCDDVSIVLQVKCGEGGAMVNTSKTYHQCLGLGLNMAIVVWVWSIAADDVGRSEEAASVSTMTYCDGKKQKHMIHSVFLNIDILL